MFNKIQLQTNNTNLDTLVTRVNAAKDTAASLPEVGEQATPVISVDSSNGLITATAGNKSVTHQLAFQAAKTITPTTTDQTAVAAGYYTGGAVTVKGDSNLIAGNIKNGISIFGVNGTYVGSGGSSGGNTDNEANLIARTITSYENNQVTSIGDYAFFYWDGLTSVSFPECTSIGYNAFYYCDSLTSVNFPKCTSIGEYAFADCYSLTSASFPECVSINHDGFDNCRNLISVNFPVCTTIGGFAFAHCQNLTLVSFPMCTEINQHAFDGCTQLRSIYLGASTVCTLANSNAFINTEIGSNKGSIFVPASLVSAYKAATNWTYFANRIFSM